MDVADIEKKFEKLKLNYETQLDSSIESIVLEGKKLKNALKEQISLQMEWEHLLSRAKNLKEACEILKEEEHSRAVTEELKDSYRDTSVTEAKIFANGDPEVKKIKRLGNKVSSLYEDIRSGHEVVTSRKYVLNNITNATVASVENSVI